jgi:hypothetical protein
MEVSRGVYGVICSINVWKYPSCSCMEVSKIVMEKEASLLGIVQKVSTNHLAFYKISFIYKGSYQHSTKGVVISHV